MARKLPSLAAALLRAGLACAAGVMPSAGHAADRGQPAITLEAGSGRLIKLRSRAGNVFVADPKIAEVRPASPDSIFIFGLAPGHTSVAAVDAAGNSVGQYGLTVMPSSYAQHSAHGLLAREVPGNGIIVQQGPDSLTLSGQASSPESAQEAVSVARNELDKDGQVFNRMSLQGSMQVNLRVRIAEMSRTLTRELGINWQSVNSLGTQAVVGVSTTTPLAALSTLQSSVGFLSRFNLAGRRATLDTVIDALSQDQLVHMLAEPNLTTMSGEPASFLVGGEFPIPVAFNNNDITVDFKQYGISLSFVPTVLADGQISLHVRPEVSALTTQGAVSISEGNNSTLQIPALTVRRADTTVQLGSGQSFAIAGLLQDSTTDAGLGLPFLGDVPVLGALFRSDSFQRNEDELVIVVTPYIVKPVASPSELRLPTDSWTPPNDLERILLLRQNGTAAPNLTATRASAPVHVPGDAGFIVE